MSPRTEAGAGVNMAAPPHSPTVRRNLRAGLCWASHTRQFPCFLPSPAEGMSYPRLHWLKETKPKTLLRRSEDIWSHTTERWHRWGSALLLVPTSTASCWGDRGWGEHSHMPLTGSALSQNLGLGAGQREASGACSGGLLVVWGPPGNLVARDKAFLLSLPGKRAHHPGGSAVENPPTMQETWVQSWSQEDPLEEGMATHSSILAWRIPGTGAWGRKELDMTEVTWHACMYKIDNQQGPTV